MKAQDEKRIDKAFDLLQILIDKAKAVEQKWNGTPHTLYENLWNKLGEFEEELRIYLDD